MLREVKGCDLCGDFPVSLHARCHPTAPLKADMLDGNTLVLSCYLPSCGQEVARLSVAGDGMVVVPRECSGEVWSDLKAELCKHMLRERSESDPDRRMALLDVAALDLYAVVIAAQGGGP